MLTWLLTKVFEREGGKKKLDDLKKLCSKFPLERIWNMDETVKESFFYTGQATMTEETLTYTHLNTAKLPASDAIHDERS